MAVASIEMFSPALGHPVSYNAILPDTHEVGPGPYPVLVLLHGKYDSYTSWLYKSKLVWYLQKVPLIVILPDGGNYFWTDMTESERYEQAIVNDLWDHVTGTFRVRARAKWAIGGLSMGGFGAIRLGLKHTDKFGSIYAHSSYIPKEEELLEWDFPPKAAVRRDMAIYRLLDRFSGARRKDFPLLSFDCGLDDSLLMHNRRFHQHLDDLKLPHHYFEYPGAHDWDYWDQHVQAGLVQHCTYFGIPAPANRSAAAVPSSS